MKDIAARFLTLIGLLVPVFGSYLYEIYQRPLSPWFWDVVWWWSVVTVMLWTLAWAGKIAGIEPRPLSSDQKLPEDPSRRV